LNAHQACLSLAPPEGLIDIAAAHRRGNPSPLLAASLATLREAIARRGAEFSHASHSEEYPSAIIDPLEPS
jgi:hypothetical protein